MNFRPLGSSKMSIWCRRNTDFLIFGLPNSCSKNESPQSSKILRFVLSLGAMFLAFRVKHATKNQVKKGVGKKLEKSGPKEGWGRLTGGKGDSFLSQAACWGVGGFNQYNQIAHYLTRPWG